MAWLVGLDEAGYGPNLGPFVMTMVACQIQNPEADQDLWKILHTRVRRASEPKDDRLVVDDSKAVYCRTKGIGSLELPVMATLNPDSSKREQTLIDWLQTICIHGLDQLLEEAWFRGDGLIPVNGSTELIAQQSRLFVHVCQDNQIGPWIFRTVIVPTKQFNQIVSEQGSKGGVLTHALIQLFKALLEELPGNDSVQIAVDKHGGRNTYTAMLQDAVPGSMVWVEQESMHRSVYRIEGLGRAVKVVFQPRADADHLPVALASMGAKYLRERFMLEFNQYWMAQVPGIQPTAGYPQDARRFFAAVQDQATRLGLKPCQLWREK